MFAPKSKWKPSGEIKPYASATYRNISPSKSINYYATLPYTIRMCLLSHREMEFYGILTRLLKQQRYIVSIKPRLSEFIYVSFERYSNEHDYHYFDNKIRSLSIDFLVCDLQLKPLIAIKLNTDSYKSPDDKSDDDYMKKLFQTLSLKFLFIHSYSTESLETQLSEVLLLNRQN
jgi:hypothetical protein